MEALHDLHLAQTLTYMKLENYKLGLLINFNVVMLKNGIKRVVNGLRELPQRTQREKSKGRGETLRPLRNLGALCG